MNVNGIKCDTRKTVMKILTAYCTDAGTVKKVNQDALLIKTAEYEGMEIAFMCVCDGMGGLSMGEYASRQLIYKFANWFDEQFESILEGEDWQHDIMNQWVDLLENVNIELQKYGDEKGIKLGTTCTAMLIIDRKYYIIHIGDSRVYEIKNDIIQITQDHTLVAREVAMGRLTEEEARTDSRRSVLLQCIGATKDITPHFLTGEAGSPATYILCSDGFRHTISSQEIYEGFSPDKMRTEEAMEKVCKEFVELNKLRHERDNITVIVAHLED